MNMKSIQVVVAVMLLGCVAPPVFAHHDLDAHSQLQQSSKNAKQENIDPWHLLDFALTPAYALSTNVRIYFDGPYRVIDSNGIPNHPTGQFPNAENPNTISEQSYQFRMPKEPAAAQSTTHMFMAPFGVAVNGIPFDPGANEFWNRDRNSGWQYEPMFHHSLGLDQSNAHVQPNGAYHYHGIPTGLLDRLAQSPKPVLIGYAADGFPMYAPFGYRDANNNRSSMTKLRSSYRLKGGTRPSGPGGGYDGSFVQDYEYVPKLGDLDQCNGRFGVTSEYPKGIYHYVVTDAFPFIPREWKGTPDESFQRHGHTGRPGGGGAQGERDGRPGGEPGDRNGRFPGGGPPGGGPPTDRDGRFPGGGPPGGGPPTDRNGRFLGGGPPGGGPPTDRDGRFPGGGPPGGGSPTDRDGQPPGGGPQGYGDGRRPSGGPRGQQARPYGSGGD